VRHRISGKPTAGATVELSLQGEAAGIFRFGTFRTGSTGSLDDSITVRAWPGTYQLVVQTTSALGHDRVVRKVEVVSPARLLMTTDKPIYQPGQTVHLRGLIVNGGTQKAVDKNQPVTFEVSDPQGNKVFKEKTASRRPLASRFADFVLASELSLGRYTVSRHRGRRQR